MDEDLRIIRELSSRAQAELVAERKKFDHKPASYSVGDLVLWNPREQSTDHLSSKLSPTWLGPYSVVQQVKNDVTCRHIAMQTEDVFHLGRLKPFFGSYAEAVEMAKLDNNQFDIVSINFFSGNPHVRTSMSFNVTFNVGQGTETVNLNYTNDLARSQQFQDFVLSKPYLYPLRSAEKVSRKQISNMKKLAMTDANLGDQLYLSLRYYDGTNSSWYDNLNLPEKDKDYVIKIRLTRWLNNAHTAVECYCAVYEDTLTLTSYDHFTLTTTLNRFDDNTMVLVTANMRNVFPQLFTA